VGGIVSLSCQRSKLRALILLTSAPAILKHALSPTSQLFVTVLALLIVSGVGFPAKAALGDLSREYEIKSGLLFNLTRFVEWPPDAFASPSSPIVIGIIGRDPFGALLDKVVEGEVVNGRKVVIKRYDNIRAIERCHILFVSTSERGRVREILGAIKGRPILTVSDMEDFVRRLGGMVRFFTNEQNKIRLRINLDEARAHRLTISARLLQVAETERRSEGPPQHQDFATPFATANSRSPSSQQLK
jgi:uncharacterized protein DUF4154